MNVNNARENGKVTIKEHGKKLDVHHKKELEEFPEFAYCEDNLEVECVHHHNILDNKRPFGDKTKKKLVNEERW